MKNNYKKINSKTLEKITSVTCFILLAIFLVLCFEIYIPANPFSKETVTYVAQKGAHDETIANDLKKLGVIKSSYFFQIYEISSFQHSELQAGKYNFSPRMSIYEIVKKMVAGDVVKNKIIILEGWDKNDIANYLDQKGVCKKDEFLSVIKDDYSNDFNFLKDKPKNADLEGYLFPDTYEIADGETCQDIAQIMLANFNKKLTPDMRAQITKEKKSIFDIVTMASMIEKEVRGINDKKIVSGILWKRISIGMPLQLDSTVNYITGRSDASVTIKATKINSPYNTYKYKGLPKGPISNPGISSITAAINPTKTNYWFYLSDGTTHFSETLTQHNAAKAEYLP